MIENMTPANAQDCLFYGSASDQLDRLAAALAQPVEDPAVSVWAYTAPAVVLGCSQHLTPAIAQRAAMTRIQVCSSPAGGGAVLTGPWMLGATVLLPPRHPLVVASLAESYRWFGLAHAAWLRRHGVEAIATPAPLPSHGGDEQFGWACFASVSHWEVAAGDGKIVGLAQARRHNGVLLTSAVLLQPPPWALLCNVMNKPLSHAATLAGRTSSCERMLGRAVDPTALMPTLWHALAGQIMSQDPPA